MQNHSDIFIYKPYEGGLLDGETGDDRRSQEGDHAMTQYVAGEPATASLVRAVPTQYVVLKTETDIPATRVLCMALLNTQTGEMVPFGAPGQPSVKAACAALQKLLTEEPNMVLVSHSTYHRNALENLCGVKIPDAQFLDTLAAAELFHGKGGNSLTNLAKKWNVMRSARGKESKWSAGLQRHCCEDTRLVARVLKQILEGVQ